MTYEEKQLIDILSNNNGYIKGYGSQLCRVMSESHSPIYNVSKKIVDDLLSAGVLYKDGLITKLHKNEHASGTENTRIYK